ncbi:MAG: helix-turn-helix domain-containing protein [Lacunisphaera sp.]
MCNICFKQTYHMLPDIAGETGTRILTAAESLFSEYGFDGVSLRRITAEAGVNLAAVNYHYSDKQSLYLEILTYRLRQVSQARLHRLTEADTRASGSPLPLEEIVDILAQPLLQPDESMTTFGPASRRLLGPCPRGAPSFSRGHARRGISARGRALRPGDPPPPARVATG